MKVKKLFAVCAPGLEPFLAKELEQLGLPLAQTCSIKTSLDDNSPEEVGGVEFGGSLRDAYWANLHLRTANRVLVRLGAFQATAFSQLRKKMFRLPWEEYLSPGQPVALRVTCHKSRLYHSCGVAERVVGAICHRLGQPPPVQKYDEDAGKNLPQLIVVRIVSNRCTVSMDSSGELLYRRGYRLATAKAPLRETLAAAILMASDWDGVSPLLDPFCGSGTIVIEAALLAKKLPPGRARSFAFMHWPNFNPEMWEEVLGKGQAGPAINLPIILASDRDPGVIQAAQANAARAGVAEGIEFSRRAISAIEIPISLFSPYATFALTSVTLPKSGTPVQKLPGILPPFL